MSRIADDTSTTTETARGVAGDRLLGSCPAFFDVLQDAGLIAPRDNFCVLILGENGTGKEEIARYVHARSGRAEKAFVAVNCGAVPRELFESEMFGHERGAFTGAVGAKRGLFELADGGTLFLDEIGELGLDVQHKLLRAIQHQEIRRVGGERVLRLDVRIVAATNRDLWAMVKQGRFREDLYFRVASWVLKLPPLRDRGEDILTIARAVLRREGFAEWGLSKEAEQVLLDYSWPGNIRELANAVAAAAVRADGSPILAKHLYPSLVEAVPPAAAAGISAATEDNIATDRAGERGIDDAAFLRAAAAARALLASQQRFTRTEFDAALGWSRSQSQRMIERLRRASVVRKRGSGAMTFYEGG